LKLQFSHISLGISSGLFFAFAGALAIELWKMLGYCLASNVGPAFPAFMPAVKRNKKKIRTHYLIVIDLDSTFALRPLLGNEPFATAFCKKDHQEK